MEKQIDVVEELTKRLAKQIAAELDNIMLNAFLFSTKFLPIILTFTFDIPTNKSLEQHLSA